jgi:UDP-N-acetylmuramoyl-tripeptide--D-alanyl-D-alanine ligase
MRPFAEEMQVTGRLLIAALTPEELCRIVKGRILQRGRGSIAGVSIDSRTIRPDELFIALKGDRCDGHDFLASALQTGAGALIETPHEGAGMTGVGDRTIIAVDSTLRALHDLARAVRERFTGPVVAVVGSNGKTTTKELVGSILATSMSVLKTPGNHNNHIGMPLAMSRCPDDAEAMVLEMGTNRPGDVADLCTIASPDYGVITNIGREHLEGFGSLEAVRQAELEILPSVGTVAVNADDAFLMEGVEKSFTGEVVRYGIMSPAATVTARDVTLSEGMTQYTLCAGDARVAVTSHLSGRFNLYNSLAAAAVAVALGVAPDKIRTGIETFRGVEMRFGLERWRGVTILNDVYNANPSSMEVALDELVRFASSASYHRVIAVLGDMLELGAFADEAHRSLGRRLSHSPVSLFIGVGPLMSLALSAFRGERIACSSAEEAGTYLSGILREGDIVLVKGSRGMAMEAVLRRVKAGEPAGAEACRRHANAL